MTSKEPRPSPALDDLARRAGESRFKRFEIQTTNRPIDVFLSWADDEGLDISPPYQRGVVWGLRRKRALIRSLVIGVPIPALVLNNRIRTSDDEHTFTPDQWQRMAVIDGKQRISAILGFLKDEFAVPGEWFGREEEEIFFSQLAHGPQRKFKNIAVPCAEGTLVSIAEEQLVFELINFSGLAQGEVDDDLDSRMYPMPLVINYDGAVSIDRNNRFIFRIEMDENGLLPEVVYIQQVPRQRKKAKEAVFEWLERRYPSARVEWKSIDQWPEDWRIPIKL